MANQVNPRDQQLRSADAAYYRPSQRSVIQQSIADAPKLKKGEARRANPTPRRVDPKVPLQNTGMLQSADVYYANDGKSQGQPMSTVPEKAARPAGPDVVVTITEDNQIRPRMMIALDRARMGLIPVKVSLAHHGLLRAARLFVEQAVTREEITEDQARDIQFGLIPPKARPPRPQPRDDLADTPAGKRPKTDLLGELAALGDPAQFAGEVEPGGITKEALADALKVLPESPVGSRYQKPITLVREDEVGESHQEEATAEAEEAIPVEDQDQSKPELPPEPAVEDSQDDDLDGSD